MQYDPFAMMSSTLRAASPAPAPEPAPHAKPYEPRPGSKPERMREALRQRKRLTTAQLAEVAGCSRQQVWDFLKDDLRRGVVRRVEGSRPLQLEMGVPAELVRMIRLRAINGHGLPDAMTTVLLDRPDSDEPWPGYWDGEQWCGTDGFPCEEPTHWAEWPRGLR